MAERKPVCRYRFDKIGEIVLQNRRFRPTISPILSSWQRPFGLQVGTSSFIDLDQ